MLANDEAVEGIVFGDDGVLSSLAPGATHVSASTISVALSERLTAAHAEAGQRFVAAPVFGRPEAAQAAKLFVVAAGAAESVQALSEIFSAVGQRTFVVSEEPKTANLIKLSGNFLIMSVIESVGEAMALVGKAGVDKHQYLDILTSTLFGAPIYNDVRRAHRGRGSRTGRVRGLARAEGSPVGDGRRRGAACADAGGQPAARSVPRAAGPRRRRSRLVCGRRTARVGGRCSRPD